jgi:hypothetical protein
MCAPLRRAVSCAALLGALLAALPCAAQQSRCVASDRPRVDVSGAGADVDEVATLLRAELEPRSIEVCGPGSPPGGPSVAMVSVTARPDGALIDVEVRDALTAKRVARDVDLAAIPADGRSLTLAVVAEELLRASWAELALRHAPPPARPVPAAVRETLEQELPAATPSPGWNARWEAVAEAEAWAGALSLFGLDVRVVVGAPSGIAATARIGVREGPTAQAPDGQIQASALLGGVGIAFRAVPAGRRVGVDAVARLDVARLAYAATPNPAAHGSDEADTTLLVGAGVDGWLALGGSASLVAEILVDAPLRPVAADDAGRSVEAASGAGVEGGAGIRVAF